MDIYCRLNVGGNLSLRYVIRLALQRPWIPFHRRVVERETEKFHDLLGGSCWEWVLGDEVARGRFAA